MFVYETRYRASKEKKGGEKVVKVSGGYAIMTENEYRIWRGQK